MKRNIYRLGPCACAPQLGLTKLLEEEAFAKASKPTRTLVGKYVASKHPPLSRQLAKVLRKQAANVRAVVVRAYGAALSKAEPTDEEKAALVQSILDQLNADDIGTDLSDVLDGAMADAFRRAAQVGLTQAGFDFEDRSIVEQVDAKAEEYAARRSAELVTDLGDTTLEDLRDLIRQGVTDGMSTDELGAAIDELGAFGDSRAETIARTELASAHVQGNVEGWRQTGQVEKKISLLGDLHNIDDECDECADAGEVDLEDDFVPGYDFPPYHPNCICDVNPVLSDDSEE